MKIMINRLILISMAIIVILFVGCKKVEDEIGVNNDPDPTIEIEIPKEPDEIMKEFYQMINGNETTKNILMFVGNGIGKLDINNADTMILDYEGYLIKDINILLKQYESANSNPELTKIFDAGIKENISTLKDEDLKNLLNRTLDSGYLLLKSGGYIYPEINYKEMLEYRDFISEGVLNYIEIMDTETSNRFTYGEKIEISLKELLNRALRAENYLIDNKGASTSNKVFPSSQPSANAFFQLFVPFRCPTITFTPLSFKFKA